MVRGPEHHDVEAANQQMKHKDETRFKEETVNGSRMKDLDYSMIIDLLWQKRW